MTGVAWLLIGGFVAFMIGAVRWRVEYERPLEEALPLAFADRAGLAWAGSVWAALMTILFLIPRTRFVASPPFLAHMWTLAVGIALLS